MGHEIDSLTIANSIFTIITTLCALYLAYAALIHTAKPKVLVKMNTPNIVSCNTEIVTKFEFDNVGYWYAKPTAIDLVVYVNFDPNLKPKKLLYGSTQRNKDFKVKKGVGNLTYLKAIGIKLTHGEEAEEIHAYLKTPVKKGDYRIRISAYSENGVSLKKEFILVCE